MKRLLILSGTAEARLLAEALMPDTGWAITSSLAGVTSRPARLPGSVRTGGFGGVDGLAHHLAEAGVDALIDATHPFAAAMSLNAARAAARTGVPLLALRRPGWLGGPADRWSRFPDAESAAAALPCDARVLLTAGHGALDAFLPRTDCQFVFRAIEPPPELPANFAVHLARPPFTIDEEEALMRAHRITHLVTKDSGGARAKLDAAATLGLPVLMIDRPPLPVGVDVVETVEQALAWLARLGNQASDAATLLDSSTRPGR